MFLRNKISYLTLTIGAIAMIFLVGILFFNYEKNDALKAKAAGPFVPVAANIMGFAWSNNIGWISFNNRNCDRLPAPDGDGLSDVASPPCPPVGTPMQGYGVNLDLNLASPTYHYLSGYAWSSSVGPISFNWNMIKDTLPATECPSGNNDLLCQPKLTGLNFSGWARACSVFVSGCTGALKPSEKRGGWDGWIKLRKDVSDPPLSQAYGVALSSNDFTGFAWGSLVTGWLSFNSINCDNIAPIGKSDGGVGCPTSGIIMSAYKVYLSAPANNPPTIPNPLTTDAGSLDYCLYNPNVVNLYWSFSDSEDGAVQTAYKVKITRSDGAVYNSGIVSSNNPLTSGAYISGDNPLNFSGTTPSGFFRYNPGAETYIWEVTVYDSVGASSGAPISGPAFSFTRHAWPDVAFTPSTPASFLVNSTVDFTDTSICYGGSTCNTFAWAFCGGSTLPALQGQGNCANANRTATGLSSTASHIYDIAGTYDVIHTVTDSDGYFCSNPSGLKMFSTVKVKWKEVVPK